MDLLKYNNKLMASDNNLIAVPSGGIEPIGNIEIVQNNQPTDVSEYATATVQNGSAGVPTATKGSVTNNSISITPSVLNSTGWIDGGTKTGTAVNVSASELVSGVLNITANGETNVTNYQKVNVNVSSGGGKAVLFSNGVKKISSSTSYITTGISVTIQKAGTYKFTWFHYATASSSSYYLTQLYKGTTAVGSTHASPMYSSGPQAVSETLTCAAGEVYTVYARTRSGSNYYTCVSGLVAEEQ